MQNFIDYCTSKFDNYDEFKQATNGLVYIEEPDGQLALATITEANMFEYADYAVVCSEYDAKNFNLNIILKKEF